MNPTRIGNTLHGETTYRVILGTGLAWGIPYEISAYNEQEAIDILADHLEAQEMVSFYSDHYELADLCEVGQTPDEYAEANGLICAGNHGIYIQVLGIETVA